MVKLNEKKINLSLSENAQNIPNNVLQVMKDECYNANRYPVDVHNELVKRLAQYHSCSLENIILGNGVDEMILIACLTLSENKKKIIVSEHTFNGYVEAAKICRLEICESKVVNNRICIDDMISKIDLYTTCIFLCNPLNPYGTVLQKNECIKIIEWAKQQGTYVIIDEAYADFVSDSSYCSALELLDCYKNVIIYKSFSKSYGLAGLRCGYAVANKEVITIMKKVHGPLPYRVNRIACKAAIACLENQNEYNKSIKQVNEIKKTFYRALEKAKIEFIESETNFVLIKLKNDENVDYICEELCNKHSIIVKNGKNFGLIDYIRVGIGTNDDMERFVRAMIDIRKKVESEYISNIGWQNEESIVF